MSTKVLVLIDTNSRHSRQLGNGSSSSSSSSGSWVQEVSLAVLRLLAHLSRCAGESGRSCVWTWEWCGSASTSSTSSSSSSSSSSLSVAAALKKKQSVRFEPVSEAGFARFYSELSQIQEDAARGCDEAAHESLNSPDGGDPASAASAAAVASAGVLPSETLSMILRNTLHDYEWRSQELQSPRKLQRRSPLAAHNTVVIVSSVARDRAAVRAAWGVQGEAAWLGEDGNDDVEDDDDDDDDDKDDDEDDDDDDEKDNEDDDDGDDDGIDVDNEADDNHEGKMGRKRAAAAAPAAEKKEKKEKKKKKTKKKKALSQKQSQAKKTTLGNTKSLKEVIRNQLLSDALLREMNRLDIALLWVDSALGAVVGDDD